MKVIAQIFMLLFLYTLSFTVGTVIVGTAAGRYLAGGANWYGVIPGIAGGAITCVITIIAYAATDSGRNPDMHDPVGKPTFFGSLSLPFSTKVPFGLVGMIACGLIAAYWGIR